jgi:hypothetical protein
MRKLGPVVKWEVILEHIVCVCDGLSRFTYA